jgi:hypothetical protein
MTDPRIKLFWLQTSDRYEDSKTITPKEYFNKITRNNQGNVDEYNFLKTIKKWEEEK